MTTPVTVFTGFLGSGKATLLNHALREPRFARALVIINELGQIAIDHRLLRAARENSLRDVLAPASTLAPWPALSRERQLY